MYLAVVSISVVCVAILLFAYKSQVHADESARATMETLRETLSQVTVALGEAAASSGRAVGEAVSASLSAPTYTPNATRDALIDEYAHAMAEHVVPDDGVDDSDPTDASVRGWETSEPRAVAVDDLAAWEVPGAWTENGSA